MPSPQDLLELTPKKDVLFIIGDWNAKVGSQGIPGVAGKFGRGVQNEAGQRLKQSESRLLGEISITSDTQMTPPLWQKAKRN